jgi:hypothetical protein
MKYERVYEGWQILPIKRKQIGNKPKCVWSKCNDLVTIEKSH